MGIHFAGCTVELMYNELVNLFGYVQHLGLLFQICEARNRRREKNIRNDRIIAIEGLLFYRYVLN